MRKTLFVLVYLGFMMLMVPLLSPASDTIKREDGKEISIYGFLRNDLGMFSSYNTTLPTYTASFNMKISTNWLYDKIETAIIQAIPPSAQAG